MKTNTIASVVATARGAELLLPMLTGQQSLVEWAQGIAHESVTTKSGKEISAARSALNGAQFAMTNIAMALRSATELGMVPYTKAVAETKRIYTLLDALRSGFAAVRDEAHRELVVADVTLAVKDGAFASLQSETDNEPYTEQELLDMGLEWDAIEEFLEAQAAKISLGQSHLMDTDGSMAEDEGEFVTSVHDANQLWDMELADIKWAEFAAAPVALINKDWPVHNPAWNEVLDRLATAWAASIEYADDKEAAAKKVARREAAIEDLHSKPAMARWVINHVTRRVFRDMAILALKAEDIQGRWDAAERRAFNEERYNAPASMTRNALGENGENSRKAFLLYSEMDESELNHCGDYASMDENGVVIRGHSNTAMESVTTSGFTTLVHNHEENNDAAIIADRRWYMAQLEEIDRIVARLKPLYQELRELDLSMSKLWEIFPRDGMPTQPPVYWNMDRFFHDEEAALAAIRVEAAMAKQKAREAEGDALAKAAAMVAEMLGL
jgi:hypothetical protein